MNHLKTFKSYFAGSYRIRILLGTLIALVISDGLITKFLMTHGLGLEWNPFLQSLVGEERFLVIKVAGALLAALALWDIYMRYPKLSLVTTSCFVMLYTVIVFWNLFAFCVSQV